MANLEVQDKSGHSPMTLGKRFTNVVAAVMVLALSLLLLAYVGFGEAYRTYPKFVIDKLAAQGELVKNSMDIFLVAGLPLEQFPGFNPLTQPLLKSDRSITEISVVNAKEEGVFTNAQPQPNGSQAVITGKFYPSSLQDQGSRYQILENDSLYQVRFRLRNKFEEVGQMRIFTPKSEIAQQINRGFSYVAIASAILLLGYAIFTYITYSNLERTSGTGKVSHQVQRLQSKAILRLDIAYGIIFMLMAVLVTVTLINIYTTGIQGKTKALADSLSSRLNAALELGLDVSDFDGLNRTFTDYKKLNPDVSFIGLTSNEIVSIHTDPNFMGKPWQSPPHNYEYEVALKSPSTDNLSLQVSVGIPKSVVYSKLWRSVKNFFVLFVASTFLSVLFSNLVGSFTRQSGQDNNLQRDFQLSLIKPLYFLGVFVEGLSASFLPQYFRHLALEANLSPNLVSTLFTVYFASFVLVLIPAGRFAQAKGFKPLLLVGTLLSASGLLLMAFVPNFYAMFAVRAIAGIGQGMLLVGVESYILELAATEKKTQGSAIIVFGYNGGMISGTAIGALLAAYMGFQGVFITGGLTALFALWYTYRLLPQFLPQPGTMSQPGVERKGNLWQSIANVFQDFQFVKAIFLIGIPAKAILTGVTIFALPLLLSRQNYIQEDIGQILMFYAAGVLISSSYIPRLVDRTGKTRGILFLGTLGSGLGLLLIGLMNWEPIATSTIPYLVTGITILGMLVLGLSHGCIHAPIVTHIGNTQSASNLGRSSTTSLYRFLERIGHVSGPIIVGQLLIFNQESASTLSWIGVAVIILGLLFAIQFQRNKALPSQTTG